jgi:meso-butanediol dehydrogenase / (S,S)-butanediol dehydrogenase / diacetyl reductase
MTAPATPATSRRFDGKVALLTGAASGIGRSVALRLASEGATVFGVDINAEGLEQTAASVAEAGGTMVVRTAEITSRGECRATVASCIDDLGRLDVLGNIAGMARAEHVVDVDEESYRRMMAVNVDGAFFLAQAAIPHLLETSGNIVNIASNAGLMGQAYTVVYCMTKGAIIQFTRALAMEYIKTPLRVNAIAPGGVDTSLSRGFQIPDDIDFELMGRYTGLRRMARPDDIAALFAFVASDDGGNMHGSILSTDAGLTAG